MAKLSAQDLVIDIPGRNDGAALNLCVAPGQIWGVLGPNGVGKSTLLHTLAGLRRPRSGAVLLEGKPLRLWRRKDRAQRLAVVFQERHDGFPTTVLETALIGRHPYLSPWDLETADDLAIARKALARLDLAGLETRLVNTLSGGERQRLAIATALAQTPAVYLVDEPTNHLDLRHQVAVMALLREQADAGCSVVLCLHDVNLAASWCDAVLLLYPDGNACWGPTQQMLLPHALERLYGQPLLRAEVDGRAVFVPDAASAPQPPAQPWRAP